MSCLIPYNRKLIVKKSVVSGKLSLSGAKNSALRMLAASLLTKNDIVLNNCPTNLIDMSIHTKMLRMLNKSISIRGDKLIISEHRPLAFELNWQGQSIRNTLLLLGALLARFGIAKVPLPGGCKLGNRPFDLHENILRKMGASFWHDDNYIYAESKGKLQGVEIYLPIASNGATENSIITGCLAQGTTLVRNAHITPEILDLVSLLKKMGAKICIIDNNIIINGVNRLSGAEHNIIYDNVEAITYVIATAITGGELEILNFPINTLKNILYKLQKIGIHFNQNGNNLHILGRKKYVSFDICAGIYPAIYSDMQPLFASLALFSNGKSSIRDFRWPNRYYYVPEFKKLRAKAYIKDGKLYIIGNNNLVGTKLKANDIRSGASLLLAALGTHGTSTIYNAWQLDRGYEHIADKLRSINCNVEMTNPPLTEQWYQADS